MATEAPPAKRAKPAPLADEKAPRPRNVLLAEFEGLAKADASQALRDAGGDLDRARALLRAAPVSGAWPAAASAVFRPPSPTTQVRAARLRHPYPA